MCCMFWRAALDMRSRHYLPVGCFDERLCVHDLAIWPAGTRYEILARLRVGIAGYIYHARTLVKERTERFM
jgi:hypothetical protein